MSGEFDPMASDRPPRSEQYEKETEEIIEYLQNRGDQRIGQYLTSALHKTGKIDKLTKTGRYNNKEAVEMALWSVEAPELLEAVKKMEEEK